MKPLTADEIQFIKETGYTPNACMQGEWGRTIWHRQPTLQEVVEYCTHHCISSAYDKISGQIFLDDLHDKFDFPYDSISLEDTAVYLFRIFFTTQELLDLLKAPYAYESADKHYHVTASANWLQNWKYFMGFRKCYDADMWVEQALDPRYVMDINNDGEVIFLYDDCDEVEEEDEEDEDI